MDRVGCGWAQRCQQGKQASWVRSKPAVRVSRQAGVEAPLVHGPSSKHTLLSAAGPRVCVIGKCTTIDAWQRMHDPGTLLGGTKMSMHGCGAAMPSTSVMHMMTAADDDSGR